MCDLKVSWDKDIPIDIQTQWLKWITGLKSEIKIPRSISIKNKKTIYRNLCDLKVSWDKDIPIDIQTQWLKWITGLKSEIKIPRSISIKNNSITEIKIHLFTDASIDGLCTVAYAVVYQPNKVSQSLITIKSR